MPTTQTTTVGVGVSSDLDSTKAGVQAAKKALGDLGGATCDFLIVFAGMGYDHRRLLEGITSVSGKVPLAGCSTQGVAVRGWADENPRVVGVMAIASGDLSFSHTMHGGLSRDSCEVGRRISRDLLASPPARPVVLLCMYDPLTGVNVDRLIQGLESQGPIPIVGGAASQPWGRIIETFQYADGEVAQDAASCVLISGPARAEIGLSHGADPLGIEMQITHARDNVIYEIDGRPAYQAWKDLVGAAEEFSADDIASWAIGIRLPEDVGGHYEGCVTRTLFKIDPEHGSIYLQSEIPEGTRVVFHHRTFDAVMARALGMARHLRERIGDVRPHCVLSFECGARSIPFLGPAAALEELRRVQGELGDGVPWLGMYAWGELAPIGITNYFHNYTLPICILLPEA